MTCIVLHFVHEKSADFLVAGIPAAARAAHQVALAADEGQHIGGCVITVAGGWTPSEWCRKELARLAPRLDILFCDGDTAPDAGGMLHIRGEDLLPASALTDILQSAHCRADACTGSPPPGSSLETTLRELRRKGNAIIAATAKPTDGIVSRHINRPISRLISRAVLRFPGVKPIHATVAAMIIGLAMAACLFAGGPNGLITGAVLFQLASIVDGVDGEIARATYRSSRSGAMLDSMTDAATNLSFFAGVSFNLWMEKQEVAAAAGATGLILLLAGLILIGRRAKALNRPFTFDAVKDRFRANPTELKQWLTWLTMRDFYAAAAAACAIAGFAPQMLILFAAVVAGWFVVSVSVLASDSRKSGSR